MLSFLGTQYGRCYALGDMTLPYPGLVFWLADFTFVIGFSIIAIYLPLLFPTGTYLSPRWRWVGVWAAILLVLTSVYRLLLADTLFDVSGRPVDNLSNPFSLSVQVPTWLDSVFANAQTAILLLFTLLAFISLFWRWRVADVEKKQQLKWLIYYLCVAGLLFIGVETLGTFLYPQIFDGWFYLIELLFFWLGLPLVLGIAILRYRLWDVDVIIRKTLVYAVLTALLALVYLGVVILLQSVFEAVSGQQSAISIVISTLIIAALFAPLRRRVQDFIDRRFYRRRYDAEKTLSAFGQVVRDETDLQALTVELLRVTEETMQPEQVSVWLKRPANDFRNEILYRIVTDRNDQKTMD
jgi:hypothetical protein